ncbi:MAG: coproporphyrinogen III oxidase [Arachnia propionica]|nr:MAG: coproporphyrinogen III oxidase [Arachnia propionica]
MPASLPDGDPAPPGGELPAGALRDLAETPFAVYVHVPFCRSRCGYCDFNTYVAGELTGFATTGYADSLIAELELARRVLPGAPEVATVFFGGGTPTMLPVADLSRILQAIRDRFGLAAEAEVTTEANPETVTPESLAQLREAGFSRVSLGMQSAVPHVLATLDRVHTRDRALAAAEWARQAGFEHVSLDLIYGTPGETLADWQQSLAAVTSAPVDHVSAYSLTVEPGTRLAMQVRRGELATPDDDELADKYLQAEKHLSAAGFANYEISNWARDVAARCRHNLLYWQGANWWGAGPGAHSHIGGVRFWNRKHPRAWADRLAQRQSPAQGRETLTPQQRRIERVLLELRLAEGLPLAVLTETEQARLDEFVAAGLAQVAADRLVLTLPGRLLADGLVRDLLD